jgi:hypothetical protein
MDLPNLSSRAMRELEGRWTPFLLEGESDAACSVTTDQEDYLDSV